MTAVTDLRVQAMIARMTKAGWVDTGCAPDPGCLTVGEPLDELRARVRVEHASYLEAHANDERSPWWRPLHGPKRPPDHDVASSGTLF